ncbi:MAG: DDE-type integrase/transposase/recombinase [Candidatus Competibacteraceae bacterium]
MKWIIPASLPLGPEVHAAIGGGFPQRKKRPVGKRWRMDETYIKIKGQWKYLYRAVDRDGRRSTFCSRRIIDQKAALLSQKSDAAAQPSDKIDR